MSSAIPPAERPINISTAHDADPHDVRRANALAAADRDEVLLRQEHRFGGIKFGSSFFGWLAATGVASLLVALLASAGAALSLTTTADATVQQAANDLQAGQVTHTATTIGIGAGIGLLIVLFVAYFAGGYVAGRMARFNGTLQGVAVWIWGVVIAVIVAAGAAMAGSKYDVLAQLNLPRIPVNEGNVTAGGVIAVVAIGVVTLVAAMLGGKTGMRFHRRVDAVGPYG